ncbi:unnamed protein product [Closterium sp. Yama58-4]|nr:unnamed protein product [Closterium sp. Yama58-4]
MLAGPYRLTTAVKAFLLARWSAHMAQQAEQHQHQQQADQQQQQQQQQQLQLQCNANPMNDHAAAVLPTSAPEPVGEPETGFRGTAVHDEAGEADEARVERKVIDKGKAKVIEGGGYGGGSGGGSSSGRREAEGMEMEEGEVVMGESGAEEDDEEEEQREEGEEREDEQDVLVKVLECLHSPADLSSCMASCRLLRRLGTAVCASSTDNYPEEGIEKTLQAEARWPDHGTPSYWSSKGRADPLVPETLTYQLSAPLCLVREFHVRPFQAFFQRGWPIYSSRYVRLRLGYPRAPPGDHTPTDLAKPYANQAHGQTRPGHMGAVGGSEEAEDEFRAAGGSGAARDGYMWTYVSPLFPMHQVDSLQRFVLPEVVLAVGGAAQVEFVGRMQTQQFDDLYYICICHVSITGCPFPQYDIHGQPGKFVLTELPGRNHSEVGAAVGEGYGVGGTVGLHRTRLGGGGGGGGGGGSSTAANGGGGASGSGGGGAAAAAVAAADHQSGGAGGRAVSLNPHASPPPVAPSSVRLPLHPHPSSSSPVAAVTGRGSAGRYTGTITGTDRDTDTVRGGERLVAGVSGVGFGADAAGEVEEGEVLGDTEDEMEEDLEERGEGGAREGVRVREERQLEEVERMGRGEEMLGLRFSRNEEGGMSVRSSGSDEFMDALEDPFDE